MLSVIAENNLGVICDGKILYRTNLPFAQLENLISEDREREIFWNPLNANSENWDAFRLAISNCDQHPITIHHLLLMSFQEISRLPMRIYGGVNRAIYLSYQADASRKNDEFYHLFSDNSTLHRIYVNIQDSTVRIESGNLHGHFILPAFI